jgi:hypothetical protein
MQIKIGPDGDKNCLVTISGQLSPKSKGGPILTFAETKGSPLAMRLDSLEFMIQEKMGFNLWWMMEDETKVLIMPIESRGYFDLEKMQSLHSPPGSIGISMTPFKITDPEMTFLIMLDLVKQ